MGHWQVIPFGFVFEDDTLVEPSDSLAEPQLQHQPDSSLLDVNQLLDSVCFHLLTLLHYLKPTTKYNILHVCFIH
jgi:hypothetical protein